MSPPRKNSPRIGFQLLDGSTGYVLLENGLPEDDFFRQIWSARAYFPLSSSTDNTDCKINGHNIIKATHRAYLDVGARFITTNSYATQPTFYENAAFADAVSGLLDRDNWEETMLKHAELSAKLAVEARSEFVARRQGRTASASEHGNVLLGSKMKALTSSEEQDVTIYGSLPPLVESHRPDLFFAVYEADGKGKDWFVRHYKNLGKALLKGGADVLLLETMNCFEEAEAGILGVKEIALEMERTKDHAEEQVQLPIKLAVSFEGSLRSRTDFKPQLENAPEVIGKICKMFSDSTGGGEQDGWGLREDLVELVSIGFNCAPPEDIRGCIEKLGVKDGCVEISGNGKRKRIPLTAYANLNEREVYDKGFSIAEVETVPAESETASSSASSATASTTAADVVPDLPPKKKSSPVKLREDMVFQEGEGSSSGFDGQSGYVRFARDLYSNFGVRFIGGCCGCGPNGVKALAREFGVGGFDVCEEVA